MLRPRASRARRRPKDGVTHSVHISDSHVPFHDAAAHSIAKQIISDVQPEVLVHHGDLLDCYDISDYDKNPERQHSLEDERVAAAELLGELHALTPDARHILCEGNHEDRLRRVAWTSPERTKAVFRLAPVREALEWPRLLGIDGLDWEFVPYKRHMILNNKLVISHAGPLGGKYAGANNLKRFGKSGMTGHFHRISSYYNRDFNGTLAWWELGAMCSLDAEYAHFPSWQQGMAVVSWHNDGSFAVDQIHIHDGKAIFRGRRYNG